MPRKIEVPITGPVLEWAMDEAGIDDAAMARRAKVTISDVQAWKAGTSRPGRTEFNAIVAAVRRPSAIFFMPEPPTRAALPTTFRSAPGVGNHKLAPAALREIRRARRVQRAVSWIYQQNDRTPVALPTYAWDSANAVEAGVAVRESFMLPLAEQTRWKNMAEALRHWRDLFDERGILTFSLTLGRNEVRGFSAWDDYAPLIAVNTTEYAEAARIYTMAHELGHLVSRTDSACYDWVSPTRSSDPAVERWCEEFAAALLLPPVHLRSLLSYQYSVDEEHQVTDFQSVWDLSRKLKVSARSLAISLRDAGLAPSYIYDLVDQEAARVDRPPPRKSPGGLGERNPEKRVRQYGVRAPLALVDAVDSGRLGVADAADYLEVSLGDLQDLGSLVRDGRAVEA